MSQCEAFDYFLLAYYTVFTMLTLSYWFDAYPQFFLPVFLWLFLGFFAVALALGFVCLRVLAGGKVSKVARRVWSKLRNWGFSLGFVGLILVFFKQQRTPYLGMRVWILLWLIIGAVWLAFILKFIFVRMPKIKKELEAKKEFEKYLPK
ncbi:MAG: hypothetical protein A2260_04455 [Candidatus Komeilibacteria bacterium RIFOXYA2_FULL_45_9]|nr:MAG: hypothetical protein A2260_04455 [Candidatus Komeilibacteria bacterium RIFOXYA2_FULL_45_9]HBR13468.1 hypothetical protein [Candidatus Komeilibacteria bacterium]